MLQPLHTDHAAAELATGTKWQQQQDNNWPVFPNRRTRGWLAGGSDLGYPAPLLSPPLESLLSTKKEKIPHEGTINETSKIINENENKSIEFNKEDSSVTVEENKNEEKIEELENAYARIEELDNQFELLKNKFEEFKNKENIQK